MSRAPRVSFPAGYNAATWAGVPGLINIFDDLTFNWRPQAAAQQAQATSLPGGALADVDSVVASKAVPGKPLYLKVQMKDKAVSFIFVFDTALARQDAREALMRSSAASVRPSTSPSPTNVPGSSSASPGPSGPRVTIRSESSPLSFNATKAVSAEEINARIAVLNKDPELKQRHKELVENGLLKDDDFWIGKEARLEEEKLLLRQKQGLIPEALVDPMRSDHATSGPAQEVEMTMTADMIQRVFLEHPEVLKKYKENVPHILSEKQFWTAYMHCKYVLGAKRNVDFHELKRAASRAAKQRRTEQEKKAEEIFGSVDDYRLEYRENLENDFKKQLATVDPWVDLKTTLDDSLTVPVLTGLARESGYGTVHRDPTDGLVLKSESELARSLRAHSKIVDKETAKKISKAVKDDPVLTKINQRATLALHVGNADSVESEQLRRARLEEDHKADLELDKDLLPTPPPPIVKLELNPAAGAAAMVPATPSPVPVTTSGTSSASHFRPIREFTPTNAFPTVNAYYLNVTATEEEVRLAKLDPSLRDLPASIREAYLVAIAAVDEYCRHFWSASSDAETKKRCLIVQKMREVQKQIDQDLRLAMRDAASDALPLLRLPLAQLACCMEEHGKKCNQKHDGKA